MNGMNQNNLLTTPLTPRRSTRIDQKTVITSGNAGKIIPVACIPLLREDGVKRSRMQIAVEMMETAETLFNGVNVTVNAHLVPKLAFDRFNGMDDLNRSYQGVPREDGETPIPFIETHTFSQADNEFYKTLGMHAQGSATVNRDYIEAYNTVVNFRRKERSSSLSMRTMTDTSLAQAFWNHTTMAHIVPDFDQAIIDGEVALNVVNQVMPLISESKTTSGSHYIPSSETSPTSNPSRKGDFSEFNWGTEIFAEL